MSHSPARLRKKIEWVSRMFRLSSRTRDFPSAHAECIRDASVKNKRKLLLISLGQPWIKNPVRFLDDNRELDRSVCMTVVNAAILLEKATSALAVA